MANKMNEHVKPGKINRVLLIVHPFHSLFLMIYQGLPWHEPPQRLSQFPQVTRSFVRNMLGGWGKEIAAIKNNPDAMAVMVGVEPLSSIPSGLKDTYGRFREFAGKTLGSRFLELPKVYGDFRHSGGNAVVGDYEVTVREKQHYRSELGRLISKFEFDEKGVEIEGMGEYLGNFNARNREYEPGCIDAAADNLKEALKARGIKSRIKFAEKHSLRPADFDLIVKSFRAWRRKKAGKRPATRERRNNQPKPRPRG
ncbi:MAG: hypothetical protein V1676_05775 [Candidatus Diapherotrites archaeon]